MSRILTVIWLFAVAAGLQSVSASTQRYGASNYQLLTAPPLSHLDTRVIDILTLGQRGIYDDFVSIWMLQILADPRLSELDPAAVAGVTLSVTRHHPKIHSLYVVSCFTLAIDLHHPEYCEQVTLDGMKAFPGSWLLPLMQGYIFAYKLNDNAHASLYYQISGSRSGAPPFVGQFATKLASKAGLTPAELQQSLDSIIKSEDVSSMRPQPAPPVEAGAAPSPTPATPVITPTPGVPALPPTPGAPAPPAASAPPAAIPAESPPPTAATSAPLELPTPGGAGDGAEPSAGSGDVKGP